MNEIGCAADTAVSAVACDVCDKAAKEKGEAYAKEQEEYRTKLQNELETIAREHSQRSELLISLRGFSQKSNIQKGTSNPPLCPSHGMISVGNNSHG